jgi:hypothetical protein
MFHPNTTIRNKCRGDDTQLVYRVFEVRRSRLGSGGLSVAVWPLGPTFNRKNAQKQKRVTNKTGWNRMKPWSVPRSRAGLPKLKKVVWVPEKELRQALALTRASKLYTNCGLKVVDAWPEAVPRAMPMA